MASTRTASRTLGLVSQVYKRENSQLSPGFPGDHASRGQNLDTASAENHATADFEISVLATVADMEHFETHWRALEENCAKPSNVFQSYDWCLNWTKACTTDNDCYSVYIVTIVEKGECKLVWPMMSTCAGPFTILRWLSDPYSQYGDVLVVSGPQRQTLLKAAWSKLQDHPYADSIRLRHVRHDANAHEFLATHARADGHKDHAPYLEIEKFPTEEAYNTRYNKSQRRRRKRIRKNMEQFGEVVFSITHSGQEFTHTFDQAVTEKRKWLTARGLHSKPVMSSQIKPFFCSLANDGKTLQAVASMVKAGDREISYEIGLRYRGHHFGYITAHDASLTDASPARLHMDFSQRAAINAGMKAFDLMVPADPHKVTWSSNSVETCDYFTHINYRGVIYTFFYLTLLRPLVRNLYHKAPPNLRKYITKIVP